MVLFWNIIDLWNLANYKWPNIQLDNPGKVSNEQQFQAPSKMVHTEPCPQPCENPPQKKHSIEGPQDPNGSGNSSRWTEVFGPFRVHMYCPKIVLWQRPQSYLEVQNLLCKKNKKFTISAKNMLNSFLMENPTFIPWCGNNSIFTTGSPLFREFGNPKHPRWKFQ